MKKLQILLVFFIITIPAFSQSAEMWIGLYDRIDTLEYKYSILQNVVDTEDRGLIPLFQKSLVETNLIIVTSLDNNDKKFFDEIQKISIKKLGDFKDIESEDAVYQAYQNTNILLIKTESIVALGKMGSIKYINDFIMTLRNINMRTDGNTNMSDNEAMASALITYFENVRNESSYEAVFYASAGWYSPRSGIKERAKNALKLISDDPSEILKNIMEKDPNFSNKILALSTENESSASDEKKSNLATAALNEGIRHISNSVAETMELLTLRLLAYEMLSNSSYKDIEAVPYMERVLFDNYDISEKLTVIETLGTFKSKEAVETLTKYLKDQNKKQSEGMSPYIDRRTVIATINALGNSGNPAAQEELIIVTTIPTWSTAVIQAARTALEKLRK
ncbi:MAG: HEAT repeat domain-containing protein [Spirochaetaceae bacterium]|nr:HEAT repeat domain-containing protein [Spirochaetaceae bacterium]